MAAGIKRLLVFGGLGLAVLAVAITVQNLGAVIVSAVVAAVVAILVHRGLSAAGPAEDEDDVEASAQDDWIDHLRALARLDLTIREQALSAPVIDRLEHAIDVLRRLLPELNEDHPGSELTWTVNRMATDYLQRIVMPFVALAPAARSEHEAELLRSLEGVDAELENIVELLQGARVGDFKTKAAFLRARFLDADLG